MGGIFPDPGGFVADLLKIVQSPRVRYTADQFRRALPSAGQPFRTKSLPHFNTHSTGAAPRQNPVNNVGPGSMVGASLGNLLSQFNPYQPQDPMTELYGQLLDQLQAPVAQPTGIDTNDLMNQVKNAINPIYDAQAASAKAQGQRATSDIQGMYKALADDYKKLAPEQMAQAQQNKQQIEQLYGQLRSNIEGDYSRVSNNQADLFKQLGIESALPDVLNKQDDSVQEALTAASQTQAQEEQRYQDIGNMDATFYREGSPNAILAGNEQSTNILNKLSDYLGQLEGQRASGIQSGYLDLLGQAQNNLAQQQSAAQSEMARRQSMLWDILQSQMNGANKQQQAALTPDSYMSQLNPAIQNSVAGAFTQLQRSPEAVYGKVEDPRNPVPGTYVQTTPEWYMAQADKMLQNGQIDPATHQALLMYMQLYFGSGGGQ